MPTLLEVVAAPAVLQVIEKPLFGKPYVRIGRLFFAIGAFLYQQGGALGYGLTGHDTLLGKLLGADPHLAAEYIETLRKHAASHLAEVEEQEKTFLQLYIARELRSIDIDIAAYPPSKELEKKAPSEMASVVMSISFNEGVGLGHHFPEKFREYWENTYRSIPDSRWQEMRAYGVTLPEKQESPRSLKEAVAEMAVNASEWVDTEAPGLLSDSEFSVLKRLSASGT